MKNSFKIVVFICFLSNLGAALAQTKGINYQAIINYPQEYKLPGENLQIDYLISTQIKLQFTIFNNDESQEYQEYQEEHTLTTTKKGEVNLIIGLLDPDAFSAIVWDGNPKTLKVEIDYQSGARSNKS